VSEAMVLDYFGVVDLRAEAYADGWEKELNVLLMRLQESHPDATALEVVGFQAIPAGDYVSVIVQYRVHIAGEEEAS
jgi:hypothetical protein